MGLGVGVWVRGAARDQPGVHEGKARSHHVLGREGHVAGVDLGFGFGFGVRVGVGVRVGFRIRVRGKGRGRGRGRVDTVRSEMPMVKSDTSASMALSPSRSSAPSVMG